MADFKVPRIRYPSDLKPRDWLYVPRHDFPVDFDSMKSLTDRCFMLILSEDQIASILIFYKLAKRYKLWGFDNASTWDEPTRQKWDEISAFIAGTEYCLMSGCDVNKITKLLRMIPAAIVGEAVDLTNDETLIPDAVDYTLTGLVPVLSDRLQADNFIYGDLNIAEVLLEGLVGRRAGITLPFQGEGLADITDEHLTQANIELETLHNRFRMTDSSLFNPLGEKNIVEALETQLRVDKATDLEFLTPNIATVMNQVMKLEDDNPLRLLFDQIYEWVTGNPAPPVPEYNTVAELLLLIAKSRQTATEISVETPVSVNVTCKCGGSGCGDCGDQPEAEPGEEGEEPPIGFEEPTDETGIITPPGSPAYQDRKCKIANIIHAQLEEAISKWQQISIFGLGIEFVINLFGVIWLPQVASILGGILGEISTPIPLIDSAIGAIAGRVSAIAALIVDGGVDLDEIQTMLADNEEELVCVLYNSTSAGNAAIEYLLVLENAGMNVANLALLSGIITVNYLNALYFQPEAIKEQMEAALPDYEGPVDCSVCAVLQVVAVGNGQLGGAGHVGFPVDVGETIVLNSVLDPDNGFYYAQVKPSTNSPCFGFTMRLISFTNPQYPDPTGDARYLDDCSGNFDHWHDLTPLIGTTFTTSHLFAVSDDPGLQFEFELISIP